MNKISLNEKERLFCRYYADFLNPKEAALKAGYSPKSAERAASKLLARQDVSDKIEENLQKAKQSKLLEQAATGLRRLAFSRNNDAALLALIHSELDSSVIDKLDLYSITEFKKQRDGGFEIKFTDRIKALESLISLAGRMQSEEDPSGFLEALISRAEEDKDGEI